jgi:Tfp pilus assembly protein PilO
MNEKMKSYNPELELIRDTILNFIVPLVVLVVSIGAGVLFIYPAYNEIPVLKADIEVRTGTRDNLSKKKNKLEELVDFKSVVDENAELLSDLLESDPKVPELLNQIDRIAKESGMTVTKLSYSLSSKGTGEQGHEVIEVSLNTTSSHDQVLQFLRSTESAARLVTVTNLRFSFNNKDEPVYNTTLTLDSPFLLIDSQAVTDEPLTIDISSDEFLNFMEDVKGFTYYESVVPIFPIPLESEQLEFPEGGAPVITDQPELVPGTSNPFEQLQPGDTIPGILPIQ